MNNSLIEWTSKTWNPITGCPGLKVSPGCANCYAERLINGRLRHMYYDHVMTSVGDDEAEPFQRMSFHDNRITQPLKMKKPARIFVGSMGDMFHDMVEEDWLLDFWGVFGVMERCPQHTFMLLTKRPERMKEVVTRHGMLPNVWLGVTVCNQAEADEKIPVLLQTPAAKRFVSVEPMLGPVEFPDYFLGEHCKVCKGTDRDYTGCFSPTEGHFCCNEGCDCTAYPWDTHWMRGLDWVICGGETGPKARPMHPDWVRSLRDQCKESGVPFFFKGWGDFSPDYDGSRSYTNCYARVPMEEPVPMYRVGKKKAGRRLDGKEWNEVPV